ncbi:carboxypeptidase M32, partial [Enterococcus faecalis]
LLDWDSSTGMPEKRSPFRGEVEGYLTGLYFERSIGPVIKEALAYFESRPEELSELGKLVFEKVKEEYALNINVPAERMQEYVKVLNQAHTD